MLCDGHEARLPLHLTEICDSVAIRPPQIAGQNDTDDLIDGSFIDRKP